MIKKILLLALMLILTTGCWDNRDITKQSIVIGVGIDKGKDKTYEVTLQIVKPSILSPSNGSQPVSDPYWVFSAEGDTIFHAIRNQLSTISRKAFFSHNQIVIISEEVAKEELASLLDLMERDTETRLTYKVLVSKDIKPKKLLNLKSDLEALPAIHISQIMDNSKTTNMLISSTIFDILSRTEAEGYNSVIGVIQPIDNKTTEDVKTLKDIKVEGSAIFKGDKLKGWLGPIETRGLQFISGINKEVEEGLLIENLPHDPSKKASVEIIRLNNDIKIKMIDKELKIFVQTKGTGVLSEQQGGINLSTKENLIILEKVTEEMIKTEMQNTINVAQKKYKCDFIGFSTHVMKQHPQYWKEVKEIWDEVFVKTDVNIDVNFEINRTGLSDKQILSK